jgi:hypothetical protein
VVVMAKLYIFPEGTEPRPLGEIAEEYGVPVRRLYDLVECQHLPLVFAVRTKSRTVGTWNTYLSQQWLGVPIVDHDVEA